MRHALSVAFVTFVAVVSFCLGAVFERHESGDELEALHWRVRVLELEVALLDERVKTVLQEFAELRVRTKTLLPNIDEL